MEQTQRASLALWTLFPMIGDRLFDDVGAMNRPSPFTARALRPALLLLLRFLRPRRHDAIHPRVRDRLAKVLAGVSKHEY
jgi:hypothetical protein